MEEDDAGLVRTRQCAGVCHGIVEVADLIDEAELLGLLGREDAPVEGGVNLSVDAGRDLVTTSLKRSWNSSAMVCRSLRFSSPSALIGEPRSMFAPALIGVPRMLNWAMRSCRL